MIVFYQLKYIAQDYNQIWRNRSTQCSHLGALPPTQCSHLRVLSLLSAPTSELPPYSVHHPQCSVTYSVLPHQNSAPTQCVVPLCFVPLYLFFNLEVGGYLIPSSRFITCKFDPYRVGLRRECFSDPPS